MYLEGTHQRYNIIQEMCLAYCTPHGPVIIRIDYMDVEVVWK